MSIPPKTSLSPMSPHIPRRYSDTTEIGTEIEELKEPNNIDEYHHFLGLAGYHRKFMLLFTDKTKPLKRLL